MRIGAGRFRNALLPTAGEGVRPIPGRLRQSLFTVLHPWIEGARVLDLCAGVGGMGLEALSRGAREVVLVERDRRTAGALSRWIEARGLTSEARVVVADATRGGWPVGPYDLVFLDPPFDVWEGPGGGVDFLERGMAGLGQEGRLAVKLPGGLVLPADPRWAVATRKEQGDVAYLVLRGGAAAGPPPDPAPRAPGRAP